MTRSHPRPTPRQAPQGTTTKPVKFTDWAAI